MIEAEKMQAKKVAARQVEEQKNAAMIEAMKMEAKKVAARQVEEQKNAAMIEAMKMEAKKKAHITEAKWQAIHKLEKDTAEKKQDHFNTLKHDLDEEQKKKDDNFAKLNHDFEEDQKKEEQKKAAMIEAKKEHEVKVQAAWIENNKKMEAKKMEAKKMAASQVEEQKKAAMIEAEKMEAQKVAGWKRATPAQEKRLAKWYSDAGINDEDSSAPSAAKDPPPVKKKVEEQKKAAMLEAEKMEAKKMAAKKVQAQKEKSMNNMNKHVVHFLTPAQEARFTKLNEDSGIDDEGSPAPTAAGTPPAVAKENKVEEQKKPTERNQLRLARGS